MFTGLGEKLTAVFKNITGYGRLSEAQFSDAMRAIKIALLEADVALPVVKQFMESVREKAVGVDLIKAVRPDQQVVKIVHDSLVEVLGAGRELNLIPHKLNVVLMVGLQGSGKTTSSAKLARKLTKAGKKVLLASLDTYRPAAQEQLQELALQNDLPHLPIIAEEKPLQITKRALEEAQKGLYDVLILDTAGRLHIDEKMMEEIVAIQKLSHPQETILVADSLMGQDAVQTANHFKEALSLTGVILTRVDGDARGGCALSMRTTTGVPILFLGVGEKVNALEAFDPNRVASRILDMGDVVGLVETAMENLDKQKVEDVSKRMLEGQFTLQDMLTQLETIGSLGSMGDILAKLPGISAFKDKLNNMDQAEAQLKKQKAIILSMTMKERLRPEIIKAARKVRIAAGSGTTVNDVNTLLKMHENMAGFSKKLKKMGPLNLFSAFKNLKKNFSMDSLPLGGGFPPFKN